MNDEVVLVTVNLSSRCSGEGLMSNVSIPTSKSPRISKSRKNESEFEYRNDIFLSKIIETTCNIKR